MGLVSVPAEVAVGSTINVAVIMSNSGNTVWTAAGGYMLAALQDNCPLIDPPASALQLDPSVSVGPGGLYQFVFAITAPATPTSCVLQFQMTQTGNGDFGEIVQVPVEVVIPPNAAIDWELYE